MVFINLAVFAEIVKLLGFHRVVFQSALDHGVEFFLLISNLYLIDAVSALLAAYTNPQLKAFWF